MQGGQETVELNSLEGITIREIDWKPLIKDLQPELDPLAAKIPADQHAVFFPSFDAAVAVADELAAQSALVLELAEPRSTSARTFERYQQQMCLSTHRSGPTARTDRCAECRDDRIRSVLPHGHRCGRAV